MARRVFECRQPVGEPLPLPATTASGQRGRSADEAAKHEGARVTEESAYSATAATNQGISFSDRPARRPELERRSPITLATCGRRVKEEFDRLHSPLAQIDARIVHVQLDVGTAHFFR